MWSVSQEEESANETGCELYVNRVLITSHRLLILDQRVSPHTACPRIVEIISGQSVSARSCRNGPPGGAPPRQGPRRAAPTAAARPGSPAVSPPLCPPSRPSRGNR